MPLKSEAERKRVAAAIAAAEKRTSGEIVAVLTRQSSNYLHVPFLWAGLLSLLVPWPLIFFTWWPVQWIYSLQLAVFALLLALLMWRPMRFAMVPSATKRTRAHRRAVEQFLSQNLHTTASRTGVLIYVSEAERYAEIIADAGIHKKVPIGTWQKIIDDLTAEIGAGKAGDGFVAAIEAVGNHLATHFPPTAPRDNALPNHLVILD